MAKVLTKDEEVRAALKYVEQQHIQGTQRERMIMPLLQPLVDNGAYGKAI